MAVDTTACRIDEPVGTFSWTTDVQGLLVTYSDASTISRCDQLSQLLVVSFAISENVIGEAAVMDLLTIIHDLNFDAHLFNIQVKTITCCEKFPTL